MPTGLDLSLNVVYPDAHGSFRSQVWVNGWMMGKRVGDLGPQLEVSRCAAVETLARIYS